MALALLLVLHIFSDRAVVLSFAPSQQLQASDTLVLAEPNVLLIHFVVSLMKLVTRLSHIEIKVVFGCGKLAVLHDLLTSTSQSKRVLVRFFSWIAPLLPYSPPQDMLVLFPPPISTRRRATGANRPFLPDFPLPVEFCLLI